MRKETGKFCLKQAGLCLLTAYLFFYSLWSLLVLVPFFGMEFRRERLRRKEREAMEFAGQFRDGLQCVLASLEAGYSIENSFIKATDDLLVMFPKDAPIVRSFRNIKSQLANGANIEDLVMEMGEHSDVEDVRNFAEVFLIAKRTGGDIIGVIRSSTAALYQKQEVAREIRTVLLAKQMEVRIMKAMPYGILLYFHLFSPGFLAPLYAGVVGRAVMATVFVLYIVCCRLADKLAEVGY